MDFPVKGLDMSQYILPHTSHAEQQKMNRTSEHEKLIGGSQQEDMTYDLYGICNHYGDMQGGHYTGKTYLEFLQDILWIPSLEYFTFIFDNHHTF